MAEQGPWPDLEPESSKMAAFDAANRFLLEGNRAEVELNVAAFEERSPDDLRHLRFTAMELLRLASISMYLIEQAKGLEDQGCLASAELVFRAAAALDTSDEVSDG